MTDYECLLIDDGSTDGSGRICDEYAEKDKRFRVFHKENGGVGSARNVGLDNAQGDWIAFCDSDDWVEPFFLAPCLCHDNVDLVVQGYFIDNLSTSFCWEEKKADCESSIELLLSCEIRGAVWNKFFRRSNIKRSRICFDENMFFMEDELFFLSYLKGVSSIYFADTLAYHYFQPEWDQKYCKYYLKGRLSCFYAALSLNCNSNIILGSYFNYLVEVIIDAVFKGEMSFDNYRNHINEIKEYSFLARGRANNIVMLWPPSLSFIALKIRSLYR